MYKLVPVEATEEMVGAGILKINPRDTESSVRNIYSAMLSAAPNPWRPISEAPKDGTTVHSNCGTAKFISEDEGPDDEGWYFCRSDGYTATEWGSGASASRVYPTNFIPLEWLGQPEGK